MAKCEKTGKGPMFGNKRSFSMKASRRKFKPNLQWITVYENGEPVRMRVSAKYIKTLAKVKK